MNNNFYVYVYYHKNIPFYVGKGKGNRFKIHLKKCIKSIPGKNPFYDKIKKLISVGELPEIEIIENNLTESDALKLERLIELKFGTKKNGNGTLLNLIECGIKNPILYGKDNPMYGISLYEYWQEKHGTEKANELMMNYKNKMKVASSNKEHSDDTRSLMSLKRKNWHINKSKETESVRREKIVESWKNEERKIKTSERIIDINKSRCGSNHHKSVKCEIDNIVYDSISEVQTKFKLKNHNAVRYRLNSLNFPTWKIIK